MRHPTRRTILGGIAAVLALWRPGAVHATPRPEGGAVVFARALAEIDLPVTPARLDLLSYAENTTVDGAVMLRAVVRLTWAPGTRSHVITAHAADSEVGIDTLLKKTEATFCSRKALNIR